jgi:hypothetical protein
MLFRLLIDRPIPPRRKASLADIHQIRRRIHPQLKRLWSHAPLSESHKWLQLQPAKPGDIAILEERDGRHYAPLISQKNALHCSLHILFLRAQRPGDLIGARGDIDNRLKTLFDALRVQKIATAVAQDDSPLFCLLQDDALITDLQVETDRLLTSDAQNDMTVVAAVRILGSRMTWGNMELLAP